VSQVERAVRNEDLFRQMNDRLHLLETLDTTRDQLERLVCECSALDCSRIIEITAADYRHVREGGARFVVYPSDEHVNPEIECVVYRLERYWVVEKLGAAGGKAEELDERGPPLL
jgi:hypothetical protein